MRHLAPIVAAIAISSCASVDRPKFSDWEPTGPDTFTFVVRSTTWGEETRMAWLATYLKDANFCPNGYQIDRREATPTRSAFGLPDERIRYTGHCKPPS
jgi:hypothetical protein